jgi:hypothetical protein
MKANSTIKNIGGAVYVHGMRADWDVFMWLLFEGQTRPEACPVRTSNFPEHFKSFALRDDARETRDRVKHALASGSTVWAASRSQRGLVSFVSTDFKRVWKVPRSTDALWREHSSAEATA